MKNRPMYYTLDQNGNPQPCDDPLTWGLWFESTQQTDVRRISQDMDESASGERVRVSTVFLGLDHNFFGEGPPILYETLVMGGPLDGEMRRYATREAAVRGHQEICERVSTATHQKRRRRKSETVDRSWHDRS